MSRLGVACVTLCSWYAEDGAVPAAPVGAAARMAGAHAGHLGIDLDEMAAALSIRWSSTEEGRPRCIEGEAGCVQQHPAGHRLSRIEADVSGRRSSGASWPELSGLPAVVKVEFSVDPAGFWSFQSKELNDSWAVPVFV